ncbi:MCE family protein [Rhodococcus sp. O3]|uniref:MCE family protein n=1 Tax=Rhodococcus sp. O3 TaxID=3404919 RepID=UPI003B66DF98
MTRRTIVLLAAAVLVCGIVVASAIGYRELFGPRTIRAVFTTATAIYEGDQVRVAGVEVGHIVSIEPRGTTAEIVMAVDRSVPIPAAASAVIVAQSLVAARYVQLTPAYRTSGETMADGATIPLERTAVPVEWDEVKTELTRLAAELGPDGDLSSSAVGRFVDSTADALAGNGDKLRSTIEQLSGAGRVLADGSGDIADIVAALQTFVTTLRDSNVQIVRFENRLATLTSVLDDNTTDLDAAVTNLSVAVGDVQRFVANNRDRAGEQIQRLVSVTQNLVDNKDDVEQLLHIFPTSMANFYNIYNPDTATEAGVFVVNNFSNPIQFVCAGIAAVENSTSQESADKCVRYLGPLLNQLTFNYLPTPINPVKGPSARPENLIYTEPHLIPEAGGVAAVGGAHTPAATPASSLLDLLLPGGGTPR